MKNTGFLCFFFLLSLPFYLHAQTAWTRLTPSPQENTLNCIGTIPGTDKLIAVGEGSTLMISENMGESWQIILNPAGMDNEYQCKGVRFINDSTGFINGGKETILKTIDGGINWSLKYMGNTIYEWQSINDVAFVDEVTGFAVGDGGQFFKTTDAGETWLPASSGVGFNLNQIVFPDALTGFIVGGSDTLLLKTSDGGDTWSVIGFPDGLPDAPISEIYFVNDSTGFIFTDDGSPDFNGLIYKTIDAGQTWFQVYSDPSVYTARFTFFDNQHGIAGCISWEYHTKILITNDGGNTWSGFWPTGMPWWATNSLCTGNENTAFSVGAYGMIFRTSDGGTVWEPTYNRTFKGDIYRTQFLNQNEGFTLSEVWGGGVGFSSLMKTNDGGSSWHQIGGGSFNDGAFYFLSGDTGFIVYTSWEQLLLKTLNGGSNWTQIVTGFDFDPDVMKFSDYNNGFISGEGHVIRTTDAGLTWQEVNTGINYWDITFYDIEYRSPDTVFLVGGSWSQTKMIKSCDGGITWEVNELGNFGVARDVFFVDGNTAFLACYNSILKSTDGGSNWVAATTNNLNPIEFKSIHFPSGATGYATGDGPFENTMKTNDGGNTWNTINTHVSSGLNGVHFFNDNVGLIFGDGGVMLKTMNGGITALKEESTYAADYFEVFPNPVTDEISIRLNHAKGLSNPEIVLTDMLGNQLKVFRLERSGTCLHLTREFLKPGMYLFKLKTGNCIVETKKIVLR